MSGSPNNSKPPKTSDKSDDAPDHAETAKAKAAGTGAKSGQAAAKRILNRMDQLETRLVEIAERSVQQEQRTEQESAFDRVHEAILAQNEAIATISSAFRALQQQLPQTVENIVSQYAGNDARETPAVDAGSPLNNEKAMMASEVSEPSQADRWAEIKSAFLEEGPAENRSSDSVDTPVDGEESAESSDDVDRQFIEETHTHLTELPTLVDAADIPDDELRNAVIDRDRIVSMLTDRLHTQLRQTQPISSEQLREIADSAPEDLSERIDATLKSLEAQSRLGELELSLERARLGRQVSTLETTKHKLSATARQMGLSLQDDGTIEGEVPSKQKGTRGRRWLGAMGFGN